MLEDEERLVPARPRPCPLYSTPTQYWVPSVPSRRAAVPVPPLPLLLPPSSSLLAHGSKLLQESVRIEEEEEEEERASSDPAGGRSNKGKVWYRLST